MNGRDKRRVRDFKITLCYNQWVSAEGHMEHTNSVCYVTVGTFTQRGLSSTAKTLRSLSGVRGSEY